MMIVDETMMNYTAVKKEPNFLVALSQAGMKVIKSKRGGRKLCHEAYV